MLITALVLFAIAAIGGLILSTNHFSKKDLPMPLALIHGLVAAIALVLVLIAILAGNGSSLVITALVLFVIAALGGFVLFSNHLRGKALPSGLVGIHAVVAVSGFVVLLIGIAF